MGTSWEDQDKRKTMFCFILTLLVFSNRTWGFSIEPEFINESTSKYQNPDLRQFDVNLTDIESIENFFGIKPDENGLYKIGDTMFTGDQLLWLYGTSTNDTDNNDSDRNAHPDAFRKWPGLWGYKGVMPITFASGESTWFKRRVINQLVRFNTEMYPCLGFKRRTFESDYVVVQSNDPLGGCYSTRIGRGGGQQIINLGPGCKNSGTIIHEFIHGWGFWHEHTRPDRDNYVQLLWENIIDDEGALYQFYKQTNSIEHGQYDGNSVMHYPSYGFSKDRNNLSTILPREDAGFTKGDLDKYKPWMTSQDRQKLKDYYGCA